MVTENQPFPPDQAAPNPQSKGASDEIDLFGPILGFARFIYGSRKAIGITTLAAIGIAIGYFIAAPKIYKSRMTCESVHLADGRVIDLISDLQTLLDLDDTVSVARMTNMKIADIKEVHFLKALSFAAIEQESKKDKEAVREGVSGTFGIEAEVKDLTILPKLQTGLIYYLSNIPYAVRRMQADTTAMKGIVRSMAIEQRHYDSIDKIFVQRILEHSGNGIMAANPFNYRVQLEEIFERRMEIEKNLRLLTEIRVIQEFVPFDKAASPRLGRSLITSVLLLNILMLAFKGSLLIMRRLKPLLEEGN